MARGSVFPYKGGWAVRYDGPMDHDTGRRKQVFKSGFPTKGDAEAYLVQRMAEVATGRHVTPSKRTFADYAAYWLETVIAGSVRAGSYDRYGEQVRLHLIPVFGAHRLDALLPSTIHKQYRRWEASGLSPHTVRALHARLVQIMKSAVGDGLIATNVMGRVEAPEPEDAEMHTWTEGELDTFLTDHCPRLALGTLWHLYAVTGMRRGEALGLRWRDVDWRGRELQVRQQVQHTASGVAFAPPKTKASKRSITVGAETMALLDAQRKAHVAMRLRHGPAWQDHDLVFAHEPERRRVARPGDPMLPNTITKQWPRIVAATGLPIIRLHDLRHTHASIMLRADGNVKAIAARLGHSPAVLLRTYAHVQAGDQQRAVSRFEAALRESRQAHDGASLEG